MAATPRGAGISGKKKGPETIRALVYGGPKEDRTPDLCIANAALSQLSYRPEYKIITELGGGLCRGGVGAGVTNGIFDSEMRLPDLP